MPTGATSTVSGVDRSMASSTVLVTSSLASGGSQSYEVTMVRSGLGWKVSGVTLSFSSQGSASGATTTTGQLATTTDAAIAQDTATTD